MKTEVKATWATVSTWMGDHSKVRHGCGSYKCCKNPKGGETGPPCFWGQKKEMASRKELIWQLYVLQVEFQTEMDVPDTRPPPATANVRIQLFKKISKLLEWVKNIKNQLNLVTDNLRRNVKCRLLYCTLTRNIWNFLQCKI